MAPVTLSTGASKTQCSETRTATRADHGVAAARNQSGNAMAFSVEVQIKSRQTAETRIDDLFVAAGVDDPADLLPRAPIVPVNPVIYR